MNSVKIQRVLYPFIIAVVFVASSYSLSDMLTIRTWGNILTLGSLELVCFYVISTAKFNKNRRRFMCCVLALQFVLCTSVYSLLAWTYSSFDFVVIYYIHDFMYTTYETASAVVSVLLLLIAVCPEKLINGFAKMVRVELHLSSINECTGLYIFGVDEDVQR